MAQATNTMTLLTDFMLYYLSYWQLGDLGVLRGVFHGFSKEARTRGFPSPSFGGFGFVGVTRNLSITLGVYIGPNHRCPLWVVSGHYDQY